MQEVINGTEEDAGDQEWHVLAGLDAGGPHTSRIAEMKSLEIKTEYIHRAVYESQDRNKRVLQAMIELPWQFYMIEIRITA